MPTILPPPDAGPARIECAFVLGPAVRIGWRVDIPVSLPHRPASTHPRFGARRVRCADRPLQGPHSGPYGDRSQGRPAESPEPDEASGKIGNLPLGRRTLFRDANAHRSGAGRSQRQDGQSRRSTTSRSSWCETKPMGGWASQDTGPRAPRRPRHRAGPCETKPTSPRIGLGAGATRTQRQDGQSCRSVRSRSLCCESKPSAGWASRPRGSPAHRHGETKPTAGWSDPGACADLAIRPPGAIAEGRGHRVG